MVIAPVSPAHAPTVATPVTIRLIGVLDRVVIEALSDACAGLVASGRRMLIVLVRDLVVVGEDGLTRLLAVLDAYRFAGHDIRIDGSAAWRKIMRGRGAAFAAGDGSERRNARRQIIICHSQAK